MKNAVVLAIALLASVAGCSKDDKKDAPPATAGGTDKPGPAAKNPMPTGPTGAKLTCDKILPQAMRDKYFPTATITNTPMPTEFTAECKIDDGSISGSSISVSCHENMKAAMTATIEGLRKNLKPDDLPGVGAGAVTMNMGQAGSMVSAWDDDSDCQATMTLREGIDPKDFAIELLKTYPIK